MTIKFISKDHLNLLPKFFNLVISDVLKKENITTPQLLENEIYEKLKLCNRAVQNNTSTYVFIAEKDKDIIGIISSSYCNSDIVNVVGEHVKNQFEIGTLYIHPEYQNLEFAKLLINKASSYLSSKRVSVIYFDCRYKGTQIFWSDTLGEASYLSENYWGSGTPHMVWKVSLNDLFFL